jgi:predicted DNA-binding protein (MmcQ/YjbR family)
MTWSFDVDRLRAFLQALPHTVESVTESSRWGDKLVFRVGGRGQGGLMFCQFDFKPDDRIVLSFATEPARFHELLEREGIVPAPYRARLRWIALERAGLISRRELEDLLRQAHAVTLNKLSARVRKALSVTTSRSNERRLQTALGGGPAAGGSSATGRTPTATRATRPPRGRRE